MNTIENHKVAAFIFARGGSKGLPGKNIKLLGGKPLIAYSIETALACPSISEVIVSTDDADIAEISKSYGASVPFVRPSYLASDSSKELDAWKHAINEASSSCSVFVSLPPTSPLRSVEDVESCIQLYKSCSVDLVLTMKEASRNPYFNMVKLNDDGFCELFCNSQNVYSRRQDVPPAYDVTTVAYVSSPRYILNTTHLFNGTVKGVVIPESRAIDIDTYHDFKFAEFLLLNRSK